MITGTIRLGGRTLKVIGLTADELAELTANQGLVVIGEDLVILVGDEAELAERIRASTHHALGIP